MAYPVIGSVVPRQVGLCYIRWLSKQEEISQQPALSHSFYIALFTWLSLTMAVTFKPNKPCPCQVAFGQCFIIAMKSKWKQWVIAGICKVSGLLTSSRAENIACLPAQHLATPNPSLTGSRSSFILIKLMHPKRLCHCLVCHSLPFSRMPEDCCLIPEDAYSLSEISPCPSVHGEVITPTLP